MMSSLKCLLIISYLIICLFSSEKEEEEGDQIQNSLSSGDFNTTLKISNSILKEYVTKYITIMELSNLYRTNQRLYFLYGGENFTKWLKKNSDHLKSFFKPSIYEEIFRPQFDFVLKFPPARINHYLAETDCLTPTFTFLIKGSIDRDDGAGYLKKKFPEDETDEMPIRRKTNLSYPVIRILMDENENFHYEFCKNALTEIPSTGLTFSYKFDEGRIDIFDGNKIEFLGYVNLNNFAFKFQENCARILPQQIHLFIPTIFLQTSQF